MPRETPHREEAPGPWYAVWAAVAQAAEELRQRRAEAAQVAPSEGSGN